jgi:predicted nuclease of predicted toxin-antitoxin system
MKILLDENIDVNFKEELSDFNIQTVRDNNRTGIENGKLLEPAIKNNYNVFITLDSNLRYQQNLSKYKIHILVIKTKDSRLTHIKLFLPEIKKNLIKISQKNEFEVIEIFL